MIRPNWVDYTILLVTIEFLEKKVQLAPMWLFAKLLRKKIEETWKESYTVVCEHCVPLRANVIRFHVVYKVVNEKKIENVSKLTFAPTKFTTLKKKVSETILKTISDSIPFFAIECFSSGPSFWVY